MSALELVEISYPGSDRRFKVNRADLSGDENEMIRLYQLDGTVMPSAVDAWRTVGGPGTINRKLAQQAVSDAEL